ncbi:MAG TPA: Asp-tRNA(Asn)/Glu-tRNA(Gln) amidotransferase subunit GatB [Candidatus Pacearchaeota archaeon]|jgi:aspartyl-tRNA(Asn)/glutamyl-tRNA(Gln) amidotransferase subunit B|nr:Asp-tRNA(Asn)/Glu-tRNA(Gln) amidotransferase subunit GatB [Candidatus Pacearchaeota archaeon]HPO06373.1 Asp-tRNA(Asn)/Glu-tRNA(Gln) amidotransferase subunit GatB [Candidatus Pacearchaeota archaeon]
MEYVPTIGLEIHCELKTASKMFCSCPNRPDTGAPNTNVCPVCLGHPGTLPVANREAIRLTRLVGLALDSRILEHSKFDRKNYFYPDLPKGYQISQYDQPLCSGGYLEISDGGKPKKIGITRVHLEEDTGKLMHSDDKDHSLVDFNRGGVPLMELVTEPDIENADQAREFVKELQLILRHLGASDADMEKGQLRVEVNISLGRIAPDGKKKLGTKVEIKNLNSLKAVEGSVAFEIGRQTARIKNGEKVVQETRGWNEFTGQTFSQREKEEAFDYRYFPEPDIPPLAISPGEIEKLKAAVGELPAKKRFRLAEQYGLGAAIVEIFVVNRDLGEYFEKIASELEEWVNVKEGDCENSDVQNHQLARLCANYLTTDVLGALAGKSFCEKEFPVSPENFAEFICLINKGEITSKIAKQVLAEMMKTGNDPSAIITQKGLSQIRDEKQIAAMIDEVLVKNQKAATDYRAGKQNAFQFLVGQTLAAAQGRANPDLLKKILLEKLAEVRE